MAARSVALPLQAQDKYLDDHGRVISGEQAEAAKLSDPWGAHRFNLAGWTLWKDWLDAGRFKALPAVSEWSDFDDCHWQPTVCVLLQISLSVHLNMSEPKNGQALSTTQDARPRYTGERLLRERPKIYRQVVRLLGEGWSANKICKWCHVTRETIRAVERREAVEISERKKTLAAMLANVAELGASRMEETIGTAGLRDASIGTGIAVDKMLALTGQMPSVQIAVLATPAEDAKRRATDAKLDEIAALLREPRHCGNRAIARISRKRANVPAKTGRAIAPLHLSRHRAALDRRCQPRSNPDTAQSAYEVRARKDNQSLRAKVKQSAQVLKFRNENNKSGSYTPF
jgi:hypothetical protein